MNFSVTGEPAPSQLDQKRKQLMQSLLRGGPGAQRLLAQPGGRAGGLVRGFTANDSPFASVPGVPFNPFLAQLQRGVGGLEAPTQAFRGQVNDLTAGGNGSAPGAGIPAQGAAPSPMGGPVSDSGTTPDLASLMAAAGVTANAPGGSRGLYIHHDPGEAPPPDQPVQGIPYLRPAARIGRFAG